MQGSLSDGFEGKKGRENGSMKSRFRNSLLLLFRKRQKPLQGSFRGGERRRETADENGFEPPSFFVQGVEFFRTAGQQRKTMLQWSGKAE